MIIFAPELYRFMAFVLVGVFNTLFDFIVWHLLVSFFAKKSNVQKQLARLHLNQYGFAQAVSFLLASSLSFFLNRYLVFTDSQVSIGPRSGLIFFAINVVSMAISVLLINFLTSNTFILRQVSYTPALISKKWPLWSKILTASVTLFINYFGYKWLVF